MDPHNMNSNYPDNNLHYTNDPNFIQFTQPYYNESMQDAEVRKIIKNINEICESDKKLDIAHRQKAFNECLKVLALHYGK